MPILREVGNITCQGISDLIQRFLSFSCLPSCGCVTVPNKKILAYDKNHTYYWEGMTRINAA